MRFSLNTIGLFPNLPFEEAFRHMRGAGFDTFEIWTLDSLNLPALRAQMARHGVHMAACCPSFFILNDPARRADYLSALRCALADARALSCPALITQVGQDTGAPRSVQHASIADGLRSCVPLLEAAGVTLLVEPLNDRRDHKGYYLTDSSEGFELIREVGSPNVRLLYDVYHQLHMGEDVLRRIEDNLELIGHFHIAGFPNRDDDLFSGFDYRALFAYFAAHDVQVPIGVELFSPGLERTRALLEKLSAL